MSECHDDGGAVPGHRTPSIGLSPSIYTSNSQGKALTKTGQEPDFICTIALASLHPANLLRFYHMAYHAVVWSSHQDFLGRGSLW